MRRCLTLLVLLGCTTSIPQAPPAEVEDTSVAPLPACKEKGVLFSVSLAGDSEDLVPDTKLPVTLGFQQFQFSRIGLRSPIPLMSPTRLSVGVDVPGKMTYSVTHGGVHTSPVGTQWETAPELVFFNDAPLPDLLGQPATVTLKASTGTCLVVGTADVVLTEGGFADADSMVWADTSP